MLVWTWCSCCECPACLQNGQGVWGCVYGIIFPYYSSNIYLSKNHAIFNQLSDSRFECAVFCAIWWLFVSTAIDGRLVTSFYSSSERCSTVLWLRFCLMVQENTLWYNPSKIISCLYSLQPQIVLGGTAQTTTLGTATAVQTGTPQRTVQGTTATSTIATVRYWVHLELFFVYIHMCVCMYIHTFVHTTTDQSGEW